MWILFVCNSYTWGLCNQIFKTEYETKQDCYEAMEMTLKYSKEAPAFIRCSPSKNS